MEPRRRRLYPVLGALAGVAVLLVLWVTLKPRSQPKPPPHAVAVTVGRATTQSMPLTINTLGAAQAWYGVTILSQASGKLIRVNFTEGSDVKAGDVLAEVDPAPYKAALAQAEGALRRDRAALEQAKRNLGRYQRLVAENAIARQTAEDQAGLVAQQQGVVQLDEGQVAAARINLGYTRIVSPISGRAGVRLVDPGNLVSASGSTASALTLGAASPAVGGSGSATSAAGGNSGIVVINQIEPIAVTFTVPQGDFQRLMAASEAFRRALAVQALSQETNALLGAGEVRIADNRVDPSTGTVQLKARFPNTGHQLWPGQFVNVRLVLKTLPRATVIPATAVSRGPTGLYVFVIGADGHAAMRPVRLVATEGEQAIVESGVRPGEVVVTDGQMTLKNGSLVRVARSPPAAGGRP